MYFAWKRWLILNIKESSSPVTTITPNPIPGLHIVANFAVTDPAILSDSAPFRTFILNEISANGLNIVGEVFHDFPNGGFTAVLGLTESHLSIHTWPENGYLTFDVFLSNYMKDNRSKTRRIYASVRDFFNAEVLFEQIIER